MQPADAAREKRNEKAKVLWGDRLRPDELDPREVWWRERYTRLKARGYVLRPRYSPEWVPSWMASNGNWTEFEDGKRLRYGQIIDATRTSDGRVVALKLISRTEHPHEVDIAVYFSSEELVLNPANHCVPIFDVLSLDGDSEHSIIVMPLLRPYDNPRFDTIGEAVEFFRQLFEGLQFMHSHRVAHRDGMDRNIMLDPAHLYPESFHPVETDSNVQCNGRAKHFTRTQRPPKYYYIDFGISRQYDPSDTNPREVPIWGGYKDVPEFQNSNEPRDPFATDVFYIGNLIKLDFLWEKRGFGFMAPLVADMIQDDSAKRPKMDEVVARFENIRRGLGWLKLRSRVVYVDEDVFDWVVHTTSHWRRRVRFIAKRVPAVPSPPF